MIRFSATGVVVAVAFSVATLAQQQTRPVQQTPPVQQQTTPIFRSGVDLVHLDISVLDRQRRPVRGLGPADFTILEDGIPQKIAAFSPVEVPPAADPPSSWMKEVPRDVRTNQDIGERRLFVIIVDDAQLQADPASLKTLRETARRVVDDLGPSDLASVIFTLDNRNAQDFTSDRARLRAALDKAAIGARDMSGTMNQMFARMSVDVIQHSVEALGALPDRRKVIIYIGQGVPVSLEDAATPMWAGIDAPVGAVDAGSQQRHLLYLMDQSFKKAAKANVNIYTLDVCGLRAPTARTCQPGPEVDYLQQLAAATGGKSATNISDLGAAVDNIFAENASFYILGYHSTSPRLDGKFRRLTVAVNNPEYTVRTRNGYDAEKEKDAAKRTKFDAEQPLGAGLSGLLPKSDVPLDMMAAPFAIAGKKEAAIAVMVGVRQPIRETGQRTTEPVGFQVNAFNVDGKAFGAKRMDVVVTLRPEASGMGEYELLSRLDLKPGRYQLRVALNVSSLSTSGSLYYDVDVPDFTKAPVSFSGMVLAARPSPPVTPKDGLPGVLPVTPTTRRSFSASDRVVAFTRVYQGGKDGMVAVPLSVRLRNQHDLLLMDRKEVLPIEMFTKDRSADVNIALPLERLPPGAYLLTLESTLGKTTAKREVRFDVVR
jgi:VWFA-related protein